MGFSYNPLWHLLIERGLSKTEFRLALGIGTAQLAKMGKDENVSMDILDKICTHFGVPIEQVVEHKGEV